MDDLATAPPAVVRDRIRSGGWQRPTTGLARGHVQANLVVLRGALAEDFDRLCAANPRPLPLVERTAPGVADRLACAPGADLRTDLPRYHVHRDGVLAAEVTSIDDVWQPDMVGFLLGCSFSAERALLDAGVRLRHLELGRNVAMYVTDIPLTPAGRLHGQVVVSMRPVAAEQVALAAEVTGRLPLAHGAPLHVGDPAAIGVADLTRPDWGDPIDVEPGEQPVFWACGVTPQSVIRTVRPDVAVTHAPGCMFVTDLSP